MEIKNIVRDISDFPSTGITYRDISPILHDSAAFSNAIDCLYSKVMDWNIDVVVGIESKGFLFASPLALKLGAGIAMARKLGSSHQRDSIDIENAIEMGTNNMEMMRDAIKQGERVLIVDDVIATGETAQATTALVKKLGGIVAGFAFLADIDYFDGIEELRKIAPVVYIYNC